MCDAEAALREGRGLLAAARGVVVLTGAGVSAESGVPTFRGEEGLWKRYRAEDLATPAAFREDPRLVWEWYAWRRETVEGCRPNAAHLALARLALERSDVTLVTQNVDGLHEAAAREEAGDADPSSALPLELHGSLFRVRCTRCSRREAHRGPVDASSEQTLPRCPSCRELLRPDVVWFGESLPSDVVEAAFGEARTAGLCLVVGTSARVHPAASLPLAVREAGGTVVEVNPADTALTARADLVLRGPAGRILPSLVEEGPV